MIGCCLLTWTFDDNCFYLESLCVKQHARNNGVGGKLIQVCQDHASQQNDAAIVLHVDKINQKTGENLPNYEKLVKYYKKFGFKIVRQNDDKENIEVKMIWQNIPKFWFRYKNDLKNQNGELWHMIMHIKSPNASFYHV